MPIPELKKTLRNTVADYQDELVEIWELLHGRDVKEVDFHATKSWRSWKK